ncbi:unnamed protein product [Rotaria magnacalcarata]|uniref:Uncharacterized protein n=1 Tax=Rotaria magnacalcarata TaxID=392030 RepID=A0A816L207_9BILA|nr:unnamed protein product [Rotaria magnacalcarata]CAF4681060.1 unnamed protein product [Rotaria magnacalcarata]
MTFLLHVEFDATSESTATKILESLARMAAIVHRDHPKVFLDHGCDAEFGKLLLEAFDTTTGKSRKELCIRSDINSPLSQITASILDGYLHVTYISLQQGFFHRNLIENREVDLLILCTGCDQNVYEQLNSLVSCATCVTFEESDGNRQLIAVITNISSKKQLMTDKKPSIDTMEVVCSHEETIRKFKDIIDHYFQVQSIHVQTSFSGYIRHKSLS